MFDGMRHTTYGVWLGGGHLSFCQWGSPFDQRRALRYAMSDRKSRLISICMLVGAVVMIGLALTGTLQMRVPHPPVAQVVTK